MTDWPGRHCSKIV